MSILQRQVIRSLDGLSDENLQFLLDMIQRFMKPTEIKEKNNENNESVMTGKGTRRIGSLEGQDLIDADYDIDEDNEIFYSTASIWEITIKHMLHPDKLRISGSLLEKGCEDNGYLVLPIMNRHAMALETLKRPESAPQHNDPFIISV